MDLCKYIALLLLVLALLVLMCCGSKWTGNICLQPGETYTLDGRDRLLTVQRNEGVMRIPLDNANITIKKCGEPDACPCKETL